MRRKVSGRKRKGAVAGRKRKTTRRRRRVSGIGSLDIGGMLTTAAGVGAGAIAGRLLNTIILAPNNITPIVSGMIQTAAGFALPMLVKNAFVADVGKGMMANGIMVSVVSTGIISGIDGSSTMAYRVQAPRMNGMNSRNLVNGLNSRALVAGVNSNLTVNGAHPRRVRGGMVGCVQ